MVLLFSSLLVSHLTGIGFIFIVLELLLCLTVVSSLSLDVGYLFLYGLQSSPGDGFQQLVAISVLSQEEMSACPSILPF